jgi:hypothetical protein
MDVSAVILIIILSVGAVIANRIFQHRRQQHMIQEPRENIYHDDNTTNQRINIDTTEARSSSSII